MNTGLKKLWERGRTASEDFFANLGVTLEEIAADFRELRGDYRARLDELLGDWERDETIYDLFEGFLAASDKGWGAAAGYLRRRNKSIQSYLAKQVRLTPHLVGGVDGFLQVYLATAADRWERSPRYRKGVRTGRAVGVICAFTIFLPVSAGRAIIGLLPGASRAARYFSSKWSDVERRRAKAANKAGKSR